MKMGIAVTLASIVMIFTHVWAAETPQAVTNMGNVRGGDIQAAHAIITKKCTLCHSDKLIDIALRANKDMLKIQQAMEKKGARLNVHEREVLGIYWKSQNPLKSAK
ncbi:MAG: cytochrome C [Geobacteraceae bacterium]|nr:cytochrome C [Geobacteraceae bacterium]